MLRGEGSGFRVQGAGFRVSGFAFRVRIGFRASDGTLTVALTSGPSMRSLVFKWMPRDCRQGCTHKPASLNPKPEG